MAIAHDGPEEDSLEKHEVDHPATHALEGAIIRSASLLDLAALQELYKILIPDESPNLSDMEICFRNILSSPLNDVLVFEHEQNVVATCQIIIYENLVRTPARKATIDSVVVHPDLRGAGVGKALIKEAVRRLQEQGCKTIGVSSGFRRDVAHELYMKLGFHRHGYHYILS